MRALNAELKTRWWLWTPKLKSDDGSERRNWEVMMMTLNVKLKSDNDSERRNRGCDSECRSENVMMMALKVKTEDADGSERPKRNNGSKRQTKNNGFERRNWKYGDGSERQKENEQWLWTPNGKRATDVEMKTRIWTPNGKSGSERQTESDSTGCRNENATLNAKWKKWLWTPKLKVRLWTPNGKRAMAPNAQNETMALNAKLNWITMNVKPRMMTLNVVTRKTRKLWTPNWKGNDGGKLPQYGHRTYDRSEIERHEIIYHRSCNISEDP